MTCLYCDRESHSREMCQMHYQRWHRNGDPLVKRRARGVMDGRVVMPLGPVQAQVVMVLMANPGRVFPREALGNSTTGFHGVLAKLRERYGQDLIETVIQPGPKYGYSMRPATAAKLQRALR